MTILNINNKISKDFEENLIFSDLPSEYFKHLKKLNKISDYVQLNALIGSIQDIKWHPEGDVWTHTLLVLDAAVEFRQTFFYEKNSPKFMFGCFCYDFC